MLRTPFGYFLPLVIFDGNFDLPQHLLGCFADRCSQRGDGSRGVEVKEA